MSDDHPLQDAVFDPVLRPERLRRTVSARDIERSGGLPAADVVEMAKGFGLSMADADEPFFTQDEAEVFVHLAELGALWPRDTYLHVSRVYGQALATIARAEVQSFVRQVTTEFADSAELGTVREGMERLLPLADPIIAGVHRRWIEHELAQASVYAAEESGAARGAIHVALLFVDIKGFTSFVDTAGDAAGIAAIEQFDRVVLEEQGEHGQLVKALGDGFMLAYPTASAAIAAGSAMIRRMPREHGPALHASVHEGLALHRGGDYFGRTVNLAARLLGLSGTGELLATQAVVESTSSGFEWELRVTTHIRGFREPVAVYRLLAQR